MLVPLHVKSCFSLELGITAVEAWVEHAAALGFDALALTDIENLHGQARLFEHCRRFGLRALAGMELRAHSAGRGSGRPRSGRVVCLARDATGWRSLCRLTRRRAAGGELASEEPWRSVAASPAGLIVLSDDVEPIERLLREGALARDSAGLLLVRPGVPSGHETELDSASLRLGVPLVADLDPCFLAAPEHELHRLRVALALGRNAEELAAHELEDPARSLRSRAEAEALFSDRSAALTATRALADGCTFDLARVVLPAPGGKDALEHLRTLSAESLAAELARGRWSPAAAEGRLAQELEVMDQTGFAPWLCALADIVRLARELDIPLAVRGSAVGSFVVHLLGACEIDPLAHGLLFERFLHPLRATPPDIDLDVGSERREELLARVARHFGGERTARVGTLHAFRRRSAWREGLAALGVPAHEVARLCASLPPDEETDDETRAHSTSLREPRLVCAAALAEGLIGLPRHLAAHPGGLLVSSTPVHETLPLQRASGGARVTQLDADALAWLGVPKLDLLGSHLLDEIHDALGLARATPELGPVPASAQAIPYEDGATLAAIGRAETLGCFQLESPAMRRLLVRVPIRGFTDVVDALAVLRPGAAGGEAKARYVRRARGEEAVERVLPELEPIVGSTHGLFVFDEQILLALAAFARCSLAEADVLRAALQRAEVAPEEERHARARFVAAARARGTSVPAAESLWDELGRFARYSFSRAHAASHARMGCQAAWLSVHRPAEFACALLDHHGGLYPLRSLAAELVRRGMRLLAPGVNRAELRSSVVNARAPGCVCIGLARVRGLSSRTLASILAEREQGGAFRSLTDFRARVTVGARELEVLTRCGALDELRPEHAQAAADGTADATRRAQARALRRIQDELRILGMHVSDHPLRVLRAEAMAAGCVALAQAASSRGRVRVAALVAAMRRVPSRGGTLRFLTLEDETALLEAVLPPAQERRFGVRVTTPGPYLIEGEIERDGGAAQLAVEFLLPFHERDYLRVAPA